MVRQIPHPFAGCYLVEVQDGLKQSLFYDEVLRTCWGIKSDGRCERHPDFRVISLDGAGQTKDGEHVDASVGISLLCRTCATRAVREVLNEIEGKRKPDIPTLALMLLPMRIESTMAEMLRVNVTPGVSANPED